MACMRCEQISRLFEWAAGRVQAPGCRDRRARGRKRLTHARALPVSHCRVRTGGEGIDCLTPLRFASAKSGCLCCTAVGLQHTCTQTALAIIGAEAAEAFKYTHELTPL